MIIESGYGSLWDTLLGPYRSEGEAAEYFGVTLGQLQELIFNDEVLAITDSRGTMLFPEFQFHLEGALRFLPHLGNIHDLYFGDLSHVLDYTSDEQWEFACWLNTPVEDWGGVKPFDLLQSGYQDVTKVIKQARARGQQWVS